MNFREKYGEFLSFFEDYLGKYCAAMNFRPPVLTESMRYSLLSGGKRVRPVLFFGALEHFGADYRLEGKLAVALESIHTYSLIHDDLPAMDNDDFRRGNPSSHKVFGEANAILAGDALLTEACLILLEEGERSVRHLRAGQYLARAAGADGMVAGQSADLLYTGKTGDENALRFIYEHKTGRLIAAPIVMAAILAGKDASAAEDLGKKLGILFQLTDDLLDVKGESSKLGKSVGKDEAEDKLTCVKLFGMEGAERLADKLAADCQTSLEHLGGNEFFSALIRFVRERDN